MKKATILTGWRIKPSEGLCDPGCADADAVVERHGAPWIDIGPAKEVQEALMEKGLLPDTVLEDGEAEYCRWIAEQDWAYGCRFPRPDWPGATVLCFDGIDTVSDIYLNGTRIAGSKTMYLPLLVDVTEALETENTLLVYIHSPYKMERIYKETMPAEWKGVLSPRAMLRKSGGDFGSYLGAVPCFTPLGIFGDVRLESPDTTEIAVFDIDATFNHDYSEACIRLGTAGPACLGTIEVELELREENGPVVFQRRSTAVAAEASEWKLNQIFTLRNPRLWWPKNYGDQPLYVMKASVYVDGRLCDEDIRVTGLREVRLAGSLRFRVNGTVVRLWGANIGPIGGVSHRWDPAPAIELIDLADQANMNALRLWGPSKSYGEELYLEADRRGFMIWQDFFTGSSQIPDNEEYKTLFLAEAEHVIRRLKQHPSIIVWCGGNENIYMTEYSEETGRIGHEILTHDFRALCLRLDPYRYYHDTCPYGGDYTNDPLFGDTHGNRAYLAYMPGEENAVMFTEDIRTFPPQMKSLQRFIKGEDLWPEGYADITSFGVVKPMPPAWARRIQNFAEQKFGPIEQYYDATDAESLVYKFAAAAGSSYYQTIANCRQGKPFYESANERGCNGYLLWKLNNTWPSFYCGIIDYYGETYIPYFSVKRAFRPMLLHFDVKDHIYLWGVNDTAGDVAGLLTIRQFRMMKNGVVKERACPVAIPSGESRILVNLDSFGFIRKDSVLHASLRREDGTEIASAVGFVDIERHLYFPDARLSLHVSGDCLEISTDKFARCVELSGDEDGDAFGWRFEDNFFDLLPFETRRVRISGRHKKGTLSAKAHYSPFVTRTEFP